MDRILISSTLSKTFKFFLIDHAKYFIKNNSLIYYLGKITDPNDFSNVNFNKTFNYNFSRKFLSFSNLISILFIRKIIKKYKINVIYTHTPIVSFFVRIANMGLKAKVIYFCHGFHFHSQSNNIFSKIYYSFERILVNLTNHLITINQEDFNISKTMKFKSVFIVNGIGVDLQKFQRGEEPNRKLIVSVGELNNNKNHILLLKAIKKYDYFNNFIFFIAGSGPNHKKLITYTIENSIQNVLFLGNLDNVNLFLDQAFYYLHLSKREGLAISPLQAMAKYIPIIAPNIRGINDYTINSFNGFLFNSNSVDSLYFTFMRAINVSKEDYSQIQNNAYLTAKNHSTLFTNSQIFRILNQIIYEKY
jgi:glycosyltransferase involved in cell wall biosynthesis